MLATLRGPARSRFLGGSLLRQYARTFGSSPPVTEQSKQVHKKTKPFNKVRTSTGKPGPHD